MPETETQTSVTEQTTEAPTETAQAAEAETPWWEHLGEDETEGTAQAEEPAKAETPGGLKVKYNGEEIALAGDDLINAAQKGLNYDKIKERLDGYETEGAKEALEIEKLIADSYGMSISEYRKFARENTTAQERKAELKKIFDESPDITDELANELCDSRIAAKHKSAQEKREAEEAGPWEALASAYPDIKTAGDVPDDVREAVRAGRDPLLSMHEHEIARLKAELEKAKQNSTAIEQNNKNKERAVGAVTTAGAGKEIDPFLQGLLGL